MIEEIIKEVNKILSKKGKCIVSIDGRCASGKTTLASRLESLLSAEVIHMDDFFLRPEQRSESRLNTPGGNIDYERFNSEVAEFLEGDDDFSYRPFSCKTQMLKSPVTVKNKPVIIIEGSYSHHPMIKSFDLNVFLDIDKEKQLERIKEREGEEKLNTFIQKWIPMEEMYFEAFDIPTQSDMYFKGQ